MPIASHPHTQKYPLAQGAMTNRWYQPTLEQEEAG